MSKLKLYKQAENLYIEEGMSIENICRNLDISRRTIFYWKKKYNWDKSRNKKYKSENKLSTEMTDIALRFTLAEIPFLGLITDFIKGGQTKITPSDTITIDYYPN